MALDKLVNENQATFGEKSNNNDEVIKVVSDFLAKKEGKEKLSVKEIKTLRSDLEKFSKQTGKDISILTKEVQKGKNKYSPENLSKNFEPVFRKALKQQGLEEKFDKKLKSQEEFSNRILDEFQLLHRNNEQLTKDQEKQLIANAEKMLADIDEKTRNVLLKELKEDIANGVPPSEILPRLQTIAEVSADVRHIAAGQEEQKKSINQLGQDVRNTGQAVLAGTRELMAPVFGMFDTIISDFKTIAGTILAPFQPFINAGMAMSNILMGGKTAEEQAAQATLKMEGIVSQLPGFWSSNNERMDALREANQLYLDESNKRMTDVIKDTENIISEVVKESAENTKTDIDKMKDFFIKDKIGDIKISPFEHYLFETLEKFSVYFDLINESLGIGDDEINEKLKSIYEKNKDEMEATKDQSEKINDNIIGGLDKKSAMESTLATLEANQEELKAKQKTAENNLFNISRVVGFLRLNQIAQYAFIASQFLLMLPVVLFAGIVLGFVMLFVLAWLFGGPFRDLLINGFQKILLSAFDWFFGVMDRLISFLNGDLPNGMENGLRKAINDFMQSVIPQIWNLISAFVPRFVRLIFWQLPAALAPIIGDVLKIITSLIVRLPFMIIEGILKYFGISTGFFQVIYSAIDGIMWLLTPVFIVAGFLSAVLIPTLMAYMVFMKAWTIATLVWRKMKMVWDATKWAYQFLFNAQFRLQMLRQFALQSRVLLRNIFGRFLGQRIFVAGQFLAHQAFMVGRFLVTMATGLVKMLGGALFKFIVPVLGKILLAIPVIGWIILAIGAITALIWYFREEIWGLIKPAIDWIWGILQPVISWIWDGLKTAIGFIWNIIKSVWSVLSQIGSFILYYATLPLRTVLNIIGGFLPRMMGGGRWGDGLLGMVGVSQPNVSGVLPQSASDGSVSREVDEPQQDNDGLIKGILDGIMGLPVISQLSTLFGWVWSILRPVIRNVWDRIQTLWSWLTEDLIRLAGVAIGAVLMAPLLPVIAVVYLLWDYIEPIVSWIWDLLKPMVMWVWDNLHPIITSIWDRIQTLWSWLTEDMIRLAGVAIGAVLMAPLLPVIAVVYLLWDYIEPVVNWVWNLLRPAILTVWGVIQSVWAVLKQIGSFILYYATLPLRTVLNIIGGFLPRWAGGGQWGDGLLGMVGVSQPSIPGVSSESGSVGSVSREVDEPEEESSKNEGLVKSILEGIMGLPIISQLSSFVQWYSQVLKVIVGNIWNRIQTLWSWLTEDLIRLAGVAIGTVLMAPLLPVIAVVYLLWDYIEPVVNWVWNLLQPVVNWMWEGLKTAWDTLMNIVSTVWDTIVSVFDSLRGARFIGKFIPQLPQLAEGGIASDELVAVLAEEGYDEAVIPFNDKGKSMLLDMFKSIFEDISFGDMGKNIKDYYNKTIDYLGSNFDGIFWEFNYIINSINSNNIKEYIFNLYNSTLQYISDRFSSLFEIIKNSLKYIDSKFEEILDTLTKNKPGGLTGLLGRLFNFDNLFSFDLDDIKTYISNIVKEEAGLLFDKLAIEFDHTNKQIEINRAWIYNIDEKISSLKPENITNNTFNVENINITETNFDSKLEENNKLIMNKLQHIENSIQNIKIPEPQGEQNTNVVQQHDPNYELAKYLSTGFITSGD